MSRIAGYLAARVRGFAQFSQRLTPDILFFVGVVLLLLILAKASPLPSRSKKKTAPDLSHPPAAEDSEPAEFSGIGLGDVLRLERGIMIARKATGVRDLAQSLIQQDPRLQLTSLAPDGRYPVLIIRGPDGIVSILA